MLLRRNVLGPIFRQCTKLDHLGGAFADICPAFRGYVCFVLLKEGFDAF
jgi:hypothetical protein